MKKYLLMLTFLLLSLLITACSQEKDEPQAESVDVSGLRPTAPAGVDENFRSDSALLVGNTGRPQLLEFFAFW